MSPVYVDDSNVPPQRGNDIQFGDANRIDEFSRDLYRDVESIELHSQPQLVEPTSERATLFNDDGSFEIDDIVATLAKSTDCLHADIVRLFTTTIQLQQQIMELEKDKDQMKEMLDSMMQMFHAVQLNNHVLQNEMETIKETMNNSSHHTSSQGTFLWKISDISNKIATANSEQETSIYSPIFYTSPSGYKFRMRLHLTRSEQAPGEHVSISLFLFPGDSDPMLPWPFTNKITFCLYDQTAANRHIFESFRPDPKSDSFQRPRTSMNIGAGVAEFFPRKILQEDHNCYVRDDSILIGCIVHWSSTLKQLKSFLLCFIVVCFLFILTSSPLDHEVLKEPNTES